MARKGLCSTCVNEKGCTFPRKFPVLQCEEFTGYEPKPRRPIAAEGKKIDLDDETIIWE